LKKRPFRVGAKQLLHFSGKSLAGTALGADHAEVGSLHARIATAQVKTIKK
jgi:hypothetical protein